MSHITSSLRTGIASGSFPGAARTSPYPIYASSSTPSDTIPNGSPTNFLSSAAEHTFPPDLPPVYITLTETEWLTGGTLLPIKMFRLPLPRQLHDPFEVGYDTGFEPLSLGGLTDRVNRLGSTLAGAIINTFKTVTMTQPIYRVHTMEWKLSPKNFQEAEVIQRIVFQLRKGMTPKKSLESSTLIMKFPNVYVVHFHPNPKFLYKFKPCVITKIDVNYTGGNPVPAFYRQEGSDPQAMPAESVTLQISLLELEFWLDGDTPALTDYKENNGLPTDDPHASNRWFEFGTIQADADIGIGAITTDQPLGS